MNGISAFNLTLLSNNSMPKHPENTLSSFTNQLPVEIQLAGEWVVGVSEIYLNKLDSKLSRKRRQVESWYDRINKMNADLRNMTADIRNTSRYTLQYTKLRDKLEFEKDLLKKQINNKEKKEERDLLDRKIAREMSAEDRQFWTDLFLSKVSENAATDETEENGDMEGNMDDKDENPKEITTQSSDAVSQPIENKVTTQTPDVEVQTIENKVTSRISDVESHPIENMSSYLEDDDNDRLNFTFLYCDLIKSRIVGDYYYQCLKVIPASSNEQLIEFNNVEYYPLQKSNFDSISLTLQNDEGEKIAFQTSINPTMVTLHFKRLH